MNYKIIITVFEFSQGEKDLLKKYQQRNTHVREMYHMLCCVKSSFFQGKHRALGKGGTPSAMWLINASIIKAFVTWKLTPGYLCSFAVVSYCVMGWKIVHKYYKLVMIGVTKLLERVDWQKQSFFTLMNYSFTLFVLFEWQR